MCRIMYEGRVSTNCSLVRSDFEKRDCRELVQLLATKLIYFHRQVKMSCDTRNARVMNSTSV